MITIPIVKNILRFLENGNVKLIIDAIFSSFFDPNPIYFDRQHEKGVKPIRKALVFNPPEQLLSFRKSLIRNAFLLGCLDFTEDATVEYLIIGYGKKRGRGTDIHQIEYAVGKESSVKISEETKNRISQHILQESRNEVVIFHNHTLNLVNIILDNIPLASFKDRNILLIMKYLAPVALLKTLLDKGSLRFYLGENGFVREFNTPNILVFLNLQRGI